MKKRLALVLALLLLASCSIHVSATDITMIPGETTTVSIEVYRWFSGTFTNTGTPEVSSSDPSIISVTRATPVIIQAHHPGTAYINSPEATYSLVTVHVLACMPVTVQPLTATEIGTKVGSTVHLQVKTTGTLDLGMNWFEEKPDGWSTIPFSANSRGYDYTPKASGRYRFMVRYTDRCGSADAIFTVIASTRQRVVRP